jgi:hypothetical protein
MQKKNLLCFTIFAAVLILSGCATRFATVKENPSLPKLSGYKSIYVGWLDLNEEEWKNCGYASKNIWLAEIKKHNIKGLQEYIKLELPDKTVFGASSKTDTYTGKGDLFLKFKIIKLDTSTGAFKDTDFSVDVNFIDGKSGNTLYTASIVTSSFAPFPRNWKGNTFEGRLDNQIYNLAWGISAWLR